MVKENKFLHISRYVLYILSSILIFVFYKKIPNVTNYVVGGTMALYGIEGLIGDYIRLKNKKKVNKLAMHIVLIVFAFIMFIIAKDNLELTCYIWAVWSIQREAEEVEEVIKRQHYSKLVMIINLLESLVVVVLSIMLLMDPLEHLNLHIILLGIELLLEVVWTILEKVHEKEIEEE